MSPVIATAEEAMRRAINLAQRGIGFVEPNPAVGAVIVADDGRVVGEGWHELFGGPHAEVMAFAAAQQAARGATLYVTLEPCCHFGKTPPCTRAILAAGIRRVVVGTVDPARHVNGGGIAELRAAGIEVEVGLLADQARSLIAPFAKLMTTGLPWIHAKWAMTLDGKIATRTGSSRWISNTGSREIVHRLRGRMDAILVGVGTVIADDPLLTARPAGPRVASRIVIDSLARTPIDSQLVRTAREFRTIIFTSPNATNSNCDALQSAGVEVVRSDTDSTGRPDLRFVLRELGQRRMTNVLVEGGGRLFGSFFDSASLDEVHVFIAPKLAGGVTAPSPVAGIGVAEMNDALQLRDTQIDVVDGDVYLRGRIRT